MSQPILRHISGFVEQTIQNLEMKAKIVLKNRNTPFLGAKYCLKISFSVRRGWLYSVIIIFVSGAKNG